MKKTLLSLMIAAGAYSSGAIAESAVDTVSPVSALSNTQLIKRFADAAGAPAEQIKVHDISLQGWKSLSIGTEVFFISNDGAHAVSGVFVDLASGKTYNQEVNDILDATERPKRLEQMKKLQGSLLSYEPESEVKGRITVFTDYTCPYCIKFHLEEQDKMLAQGIAIDYAAFPRSGVTSDVAKVMARIWATGDKELLNKLLNKEAVNLGSLDLSDDEEELIKNHYFSGQESGLTGTPYIVFEDGRVYPGYAPADRIIEAMEQTDLVMD